MADAEQLSIRHIQVGSQTLRVAIKRGHHPTPLVLFNGIGANLELLEGVANALEGIEVVMFDVPGVGGSPLPRWPYRLKTLARLTDAMLRELGYDGPVDALGVSWGGSLAQQFARLYRHRCRRLVLAATAPGAFMLPRRWSALMTLMTPRRYTDPDFMQRVAPKIYGGHIAREPELIRPFAKHLLSPDPRGYVLQQLALAGWTSLHWLARIRQPTLILAGKHDPLIHGINARLMHALMPNSRLELIEDGHLFLLTSRQAVAGSILRFLTVDDPLRTIESRPAAPRTVSACVE